MSNNKLYNSIEIPGSFLIPGFSIYVLEIIKEKNKWFYIGMTGDPYYPSARSAFHRLSGHLELNTRSTQNQLLIALNQKLNINSVEDLKKLDIRMHHFPIEGFRRITDKKLDNVTMQKLQQTEEYKDYKIKQKKVAVLENALIYKLDDKLLNKTIGKIIEEDKIDFPEVYNRILKLVNS